MLQAEEVARSKVTSIKQEAENDTRTIEDPPNPRRVSMTRTAGLPPPGPKFQVPDLHETHGPILPVERKHQFPEKPPVRAESTAKDDFALDFLQQLRATSAKVSHFLFLAVTRHGKELNSLS